VKDLGPSQASALVLEHRARTYLYFGSFIFSAHRDAGGWFTLRTLRTYSRAPRDLCTHFKWLTTTYARRLALCAGVGLFLGVLAHLVRLLLTPWRCEAERWALLKDTYWAGRRRCWNEVTKKFLLSLSMLSYQRCVWILQVARTSGWEFWDGKRVQEVGRRHPLYRLAVRLKYHRVLNGALNCGGKLVCEINRTHKFHSY
jgi:hypothetical protein